MANKKPKSLLKLLDSTMSKYEKGRPVGAIRASMLTDEHRAFCPREIALLDVTKKEPKDKYVSIAMRVASWSVSSVSVWPKRPSAMASRARQSQPGRAWLPITVVGSSVEEAGACGVGIRERSPKGCRMERAAGQGHRQTDSASRHICRR